ncbi:unnamed protein product [Ectocarpus fasciculatus]
MKKRGTVLVLCVVIICAWYAGGRERVSRVWLWCRVVIFFVALVMHRSRGRGGALSGAISGTRLSRSPNPGQILVEISCIVENPWEMAASDLGLARLDAHTRYPEFAEIDANLNFLRLQLSCACVFICVFHKERAAPPIKQHLGVVVFRSVYQVFVATEGTKESHYGLRH